MLFDELPQEIVDKILFYSQPRLSDSLKTEIVSFKFNVYRFGFNLDNMLPLGCCNMSKIYNTII